MSRKPAFVHIRYYQNRTAKGNATVKKVQQGLFYYTYGTKEQNPELQPRGQWYSRHGPERYGDVAAWAAGNARAHRYTYTVVLSLRDGWMQPSDFLEAVTAGGDQIFTSWRLIPHTDTDHDHAHLVAFRDRTLPRAVFHRWRLTVGQELAAAEQQRLQEMAREQGVQQRRERKRGLSFDDDLAFAL